MAWISPKLDWLTNPVNPTATDMDRIEGNTDFLKTDIETKKGVIVDALNAVGVTSSLTDTHAELATKIEIAEKTGVSILPSTVNQEIPKGIYDSGGGVVAGDADLVAGNIKSGANIFGVAGNVKPLMESVLYLRNTGLYTLWRGGAYYEGGKTDQVTIRDISDSNIYIENDYSSTSSYVTVVTNSTVDLTGKNKLVLICNHTTANSNNRHFIGIGTIRATALQSTSSRSYLIAEGLSGSSGTSMVGVELDVSAYSGSYYIYAGRQYSAMGMNIHSVFMY